MSDGSEGDRKKKLEIVMQMTRGFDLENPNHIRAVEHLLFEVGMDESTAIVKMSSILDMGPRDAFMYDTSRTGFGAMGSGSLQVSSETEDKLIDLLGKRPLMDRHRQKERRKIDDAQEDLLEAKIICQTTQSVLPVLDIDDLVRLDILEQKYYAVVAPAENAIPPTSHAFYMSEYLYFLDQLLYAHPDARVLGKAVHTAWILIARSHEQDRSINDAEFSRMRWFDRMHRGYAQRDRDCLDKVILPQKYLRESADVRSSDVGSGTYDWDSIGDPAFTDLLEKISSKCSNC